MDFVSTASAASPALPYYSMLQLKTFQRLRFLGFADFQQENSSSAQSDLNRDTYLSCRVLLHRPQQCFPNACNRSINLRLLTCIRRTHDGCTVGQKFDFKVSLNEQSSLGSSNQVQVRSEILIVNKKRCEQNDNPQLRTSNFRSG